MNLYCLQKTGRKLVTDAQLAWLRSFEEGTAPCLNEKHFQAIGRWEFNGLCYTATFRNHYWSLDLDVQGNYENSWQVALDDLIEQLEVQFHLRNQLAVWASNDPTDLGYDPDFEDRDGDDDMPWLMPLSIEAVQRCPAPLDSLEKCLKAQGMLHPDRQISSSSLERFCSNWNWNLSWDEVSELFYGFKPENSWQESTFWEARAGNPNAQQLVKEWQSKI